MKEYITNNEQETEQFAYDIAKKINNNSIIVLCGDLGVGKTRFVRGVARFFGIEKQVSSPTFTIVNEYTTTLNNDIIDKIFHFDVYRLSGGDDFIDTVGTDYFGSGLCIIEWGEIIKEVLPSSAIYITIERLEGENTDKRKITIKEDI